ncbi:IclR family transcriptional regulator [Pseudonocardia nematodicida]|uniref:IclR family transcriptional regulator n=1 Tax=Pseudonocardia nematodicida TaxID=1206997 RepID=A0ABV1K6J0_9PSEU
MGSGSGAAAGTESAGRTLDVLLRFLDGTETLGISELARDMTVSKAVVHRALQTLAGRDMVEFDEATRRYRLGPAAAALGVRALRDSDLRSAARSHLADLQLTTGETVTLSGLLRGGRVYLDQIVSAHEIAMSVEMGRRFPLHAGSSGKCILAHLPADQLDRLLAEPLEQLTAKTVVRPDVLRAELSEINDAGYASSDGERQADAGSVAAAVFGFDGVPVGAISVCGPRSRVTPEFVRRVAPQVVEAARDISTSLGHRGRP